MAVMSIFPGSRQLLPLLLATFSVLLASPVPNANAATLTRNAPTTDSPRNAPESFAASIKSASGTLTKRGKPVAESPDDSPNDTPLPDTDLQPPADTQTETETTSSVGTIGSGSSIGTIGTIGTDGTYVDPESTVTLGSILAGELPIVAITAPADGTAVDDGTQLTFTATATDTEDGDVSSALGWSSSLDGPLGTGPSVNATLSVGVHTITASAQDTFGQAGSDAITVTVAAIAQSLDRQIAAGSDDAEESATGVMDLTSSDLELVTESTVQTVGMRFTNINIDPASIVTKAWIQFTVDETGSNTTNLTIHGEASANAATFTVSNFNLSSRPLTVAQVNWSPAPWTVVGAAGSEQRTPNLAALINEVISHPGWDYGNALAIVVTGTGKRTAEAFNGDAWSAPILHIEYTDSGDNHKPVVDAGSYAPIMPPATTLNLDGTVTDDGLPEGGTLTTLWTHVGGTGTGTVSFADPSAVDTQLSVSADPGTYVLRLAADDGQLSAFDEVTVTVASQTTGGQIASITQIHYFDTGFSNLTTPLPVPATDPAGVTYHQPSGHLIIADSEINEIPSAFSIVQANLFETPLAGGTTFNDWNTTINTGNEPVHNNEPTGIIYCEYDGHFYVSNDDARRIFRYAYDGSSLTAVDSFSTSGYANDAEDITCDPATGRLYVIGGTEQNVLVLRYQGGFVLEENISLPVTAGTPSGIVTDPEGIAFDPGSGHLFIVSTPDKAIFEYTTAGVFVKKFSISGFSPSPRQPQGLAIGPSSNNESGTSFYIADAMDDNDYDPNERDGRIFEARINRAQ